MNTTLQELRRANAHRAEEECGWKVREYHTLLADVVEKAKVEIEKLKEIAPATLKIIVAAEKRYPRSENDPPNLKKAVGDYNDALRLGRQICQVNPVSIQNMIDRVENAKPADFQKFSAKILADEDRRRLSPLLSGSEFLEKLPMELGVLESFIIEAMNFWKERETHGAGWTPPATVTANPAARAESEQLDTFDPRLS